MEAPARDCQMPFSCLLPSDVLTVLAVHVTLDDLLLARLVSRRWCAAITQSCQEVHPVLNLDASPDAETFEEGARQLLVRFPATSHCTLFVSSILDQHVVDSSFQALHSVWPSLHQLKVVQIRAPHHPVLAGPLHTLLDSLASASFAQLHLLQLGSPLSPAPGQLQTLAALPMLTVLVLECSLDRELIIELASLLQLQTLEFKAMGGEQRTHDLDLVPLTALCVLRALRVLGPIDATSGALGALSALNCLSSLQLHVDAGLCDRGKWGRQGWREPVGTEATWAQRQEATLANLCQLTSITALRDLHLGASKLGLPDGRLPSMLLGLGPLLVGLELYEQGILKDLRGAVAELSRLSTLHIAVEALGVRVGKLRDLVTLGQLRSLELRIKQAAQQDKPTAGLIHLAPQLTSLALENSVHASTHDVLRAATALRHLSITWRGPARAVRLAALPPSLTSLHLRFCHLHGLSVVAELRSISQRREPSAKVELDMALHVLLATYVACIEGRAAGVHPSGSPSHPAVPRSAMLEWDAPRLVVQLDDTLLHVRSGGSPADQAAVGEVAWQLHEAMGICRQEGFPLVDNVAAGLRQASRPPHTLHGSACRLLGLTHMRQLSLQNCRFASEDLLQLLLSCPHLTSFSSNGASESLLPVLAMMRGLTSVQLSDWRVRDPPCSLTLRCMRYLARLPALRQLHLPRDAAASMTEEELAAEVGDQLGLRRLYGLYHMLPAA